MGYQTLNASIQECEDALEAENLTDRQCFEVCRKMTAIYGQKVPGILECIGVQSSETLAWSYDRSDVELICGMLREYRDSLMREKERAKLASINLSSESTSSAVAEARAEAALDAALSQIWAEQDGKLTEEHKAEISRLIGELKASESEGPSIRWKAARKLGDYVTERAIDAIPTIMPAIASAIRSMAGI